MTRPKPEPVTGPTTAKLGCGCQVSFATGVSGSPVTVVLRTKGGHCGVDLHVTGLPIFDHREALRPATRFLPAPQRDFEEEN